MRIKAHFSPGQTTANVRQLDGSPFPRGHVTVDSGRCLSGCPSPSDDMSWMQLAVYITMQTSLTTLCLLTVDPARGIIRSLTGLSLNPACCLATLSQQKPYRRTGLVTDDPIMRQVGTR